MSAGVGFPSFGSTATWTSTNSDPNYPPATLNNLQYPSSVWRATTYGSISLSCTLPTPTPVQLVALCCHNLGVAGPDNYRIRGYTDAAKQTLAFDSGVIVCAPQNLLVNGTPIYHVTTPLVLSTPVLIQSMQIDVFTTSSTPYIGAIELAGWWGWPGIDWGRQISFNTNVTSQSYAGGALNESQSLVTRQCDMTMSYLLLGPTGTDVALDFQKVYDEAFPFVFVTDSVDQTTWPRLCFLATNSALEPLTGSAYHADKMTLNFAEHYR